MDHTNPLLPAYRRSDLTPGVRGDWALVSVELPERPYDPSTDPRPAAFHFRPGRYTELRQGGVTFMTDLYDEWWTQRDAIIRARRVGGDVLITGLGLGMVVEAILATPESAPVRSVTVLEQSPDVISLVAEQLIARFGERVQVIEADAYTWVPPSARSFDIVWHDIWPDPDAPEVDQQIEALRSHHQAWSQWQGFWPLDYREALAANRNAC